MVFVEEDRSFFDELEAVAKGLMVAPTSNGGADLRLLFDNLKASMRHEVGGTDTAQPSDQTASALRGRP